MNEPLLEVKDVTVKFGGLVALDSVSLSVEEGGIVGLIGPNGAGKTTLFNVISGLQEPTSGSLFFGGRDVSRLRPHERARLGISRTFQHLGLMMGESVETNVLAGLYLKAGYLGSDAVFRPQRWLTGERDLMCSVRNALEPFGLEGERDAVVSNLSFAGARGVELATALIQEPRLVLLDEPTTGLDPGEVDGLKDLLKGVRQKGGTILVIAHDVGFVMQVCDWLYVLAGGQLLSEGPPDVVQRDASVVEAYLGGSRK